MSTSRLTSAGNRQAGFFLGPWCWLIGGWYLRPEDGEFRSTRGRRCREPDCACGRILQGSALSAHPTSGIAVKGGQTATADDDEGVGRVAGLDCWIFYNRLAAGASGAVVAALVAVAIWAAVSA